MRSSQRCAGWLTADGWRSTPPDVRAYSMDLRARVVAAVDAGMTQSQAAARFGVSLRTVERYLARRRATGSLAASEQRHGPEPTVRRRLHAWLPARVDAAADATLAEHVAAFVAAGGGPGSPGGMESGKAAVWGRGEDSGGAGIFKNKKRTTHLHSS